MNKPMVFGLGFAAGAIFGAAVLFGWAATKIPPSAARTPATFADAPLDRVPFDGKWLVFWGGDKKSENRHIGVPPQDRAMDIVQVHEQTKQTFAGDRLKNESYACWAKPILSPVSGVVEIAVDGIPDNVPGTMNRHMVSGNCVTIRSDAGFFVVLCHFKNGSVARKAGERVKPGDLLGLCGNSGNASEPHLHLHVQSEPGFVRGEGMRPVFKSLEIGGVARVNYSPRKNDVIGPVTDTAKATE